MAQENPRSKWAKIKETIRSVHENPKSVSDSASDSSKNSNNDFLLYVKCQNCNRHYSANYNLPNSFGIHLEWKPLCKQNHDEALQKFYIKCKGNCKKKYYEIGNAIQSHLRQKPTCSDNYSLEESENLKQQCEQHRLEKRKKSKAEYFQKSKKQKSDEKKSKQKSSQVIGT